MISSEISRQTGAALSKKLQNTIFSSIIFTHLSYYTRVSVARVVTPRVVIILLQVTRIPEKVNMLKNKKINNGEKLF